MDRLDAIGSAGLRNALLYVRSSRKPVTADDAAESLGIHRSVARGRLERLLQAGLIDARSVHLPGHGGPGSGRPPKEYYAAPELEALELPPRHLPALVSHLIDELPAEGREAALRRAGEDFGRDLARKAGLRPRARVEDGLEAVCSAMRSLGFQASVDRVDGDTASINTPTCPLRPLVAERLEAAYVDRGMWAGLFERGVRGARAETVECESHSCLDGGEACSIVLRFRRDDSG
jgi:predicted ArsR family transcriptional regulator